VLDWLADNLALIMFVAMFFVIFCGYPVAFVMGGMALLFALAGWTLGVFNLLGLYDIVLRMWGGAAADPVLASIPMFIFMGSILERSGSAADMLKATEVLMRRVPGALAVAVMVMGTILSAPIGTVGAAVVTLSVIALPQMLAAGYDKRLAIGTIASAGTLGILIPPAIMLVVMAEMLVTPAGTLFLAATMPGFLLSGLFLIYIIAVAIFRPSKAPKLPPDHGPQTRGEFWHALWRGLFPMTALMVIVIGSIFAGWATPTESGAVGVFGAFLIAALNRRMTMQMTTEAMWSACRANGLVFLRVPGAGGRRPHGRHAAEARRRHRMGDAGLHHGPDLPAGLPLRVDRDLPDRPARVWANSGEVRLLRPSWPAEISPAVVRRARGGQPPDGVHDPPVRRHALLHEGHGPAGRDHERRLPGHVSVRRPADRRASALYLVSRDRALAAEARRVPRLAAH
jgi:tripartite ATP-independent transporter DctM subunit